MHSMFRLNATNKESVRDFMSSFFRKDPVQDYLDGLRKMAVDLNNNLEIVKTWMSTQHLHNELFLESIMELREELKSLKKKLEIKDER